MPIKLGIRNWFYKFWLSLDMLEKLVGKTVFIRPILEV